VLCSGCKAPARSGCKAPTSFEKEVGKKTLVALAPSNKEFNRAELLKFLCLLSLLKKGGAYFLYKESRLQIFWEVKKVSGTSKGISTS